MTKQQRRQLDSLDRKITEARRRNDHIGFSRYMSQKRRLEEAIEDDRKKSLLECLEGYTSEERKEATTRVIYCIAIADMLYGATMEVDQFLKKRFGIFETSVLVEMRKIVERLRLIVKSIDDVGSGIFSEYYAEMVDEVETKYECTMKNYILNMFQRAANHKG